MVAQQIEPVNEYAVKHLQSNPIDSRIVQLAVAKRSELIRDLAAVELIPAFTQMAKERRGGIKAISTGDVVAGSRSPKLPELDREDRSVDRWERAQWADMEIIAAATQRIAGRCQAVALTRAPSKREKEQAADIGADCLNCGRPVACTPADRLRAGRCSACFQYKANHEGTERPKDLWV